MKDVYVTAAAGRYQECASSEFAVMSQPWQVSWKEAMSPGTLAPQLWRTWGLSLQGRREGLPKAPAGTPSARKEEQVPAS